MLLLAVMMISASSLQAQAPVRTSKIKSIVGTANIRRSGTVNWVPARVNMPVKERDAVRTFIESELEIETSEGTILKLGENATLQLDKLTSKGDADNTTVKILNGSIVANVKKLVNSNSKFEFETPTATAAIRGTVVGFDVGSEKTTIKVFEGKVLVTPTGTKRGIEIKENEMTSVAKGQKEIKIEKLEVKPGEQSPKIESGMSDSDKNEPKIGNSVDTSMVKDSLVQVKASEIKHDTIVSKPPLPEIVVENKDEEVLDSQQQTTPAASSVLPKVETAPLKLQVSSPTDRFEVKPGLSVSVSGSVTPASALVTVQGKKVTVAANGQFKSDITAPKQSADLEITITAESNGAVQTVTRTIVVKAVELNFEVKSPIDGQVFSKTTIPVNGTVTPGATVTAMSIRMPVTASGTFSGQVPIPNEDGEIFVEFEATLDGKSKTITRKIMFQPEYRLNITTPAVNQIVNSTTVQIKGEVSPPGAKVSVLGRSMNVSTTGIFSGTVLIPEEVGEIELDFEVTYGTTTKTETRTITYQKPADIARPEIQTVLPQISESKQISLAVYDRTPDDEITLFYTIDGVKESEKGLPNSSFIVQLQPGIHNYTFQATDKTGNSSQIVSQNITWFGSTDWMIKVNKPIDVLYLPPSGPANDYEPVYTLEFSIENLPDNDMRLISLVTVVNKVTGETQTKKTFTDQYFTIDMKLKNHTTNLFDISIEDVRKKIKTRSVQVTIK
jgi:hypothetical protein